jgi:hypothetical protein
LLKIFVLIVAFWRWIWSGEELPLPKTYQRSSRGFSFGALMAREALPPPKPDLRPSPGFSFRALMARETLPPPRPGHPGRRRSLLGFLVARETLSRSEVNSGVEPIIDHRE